MKLFLLGLGGSGPMARDIEHIACEDREDEGVKIMMILSSHILYIVLYTSNLIIGSFGLFILYLIVIFFLINYYYRI